jgi:hypothetical protein
MRVSLALFTASGTATAAGTYSERPTVVYQGLTGRIS